MRIHRIPHLLFVLAGLALVATACGDDATDAADGARPTVVVTTNILGDVVANVAGGSVDVVTVMPVGADPHDFQASAQQAAQMRSAEVLIVNGADFEASLLDVIEGAEADGVPVFVAIDAVTALEFAAEHDDHDEDEDDHDEDDEEHEDDDHGHEGVDPHFFTDPGRMAVVAAAIADFLLANLDGVDAALLASAADTYIAELEALDAEIEARVETVPPAQRVLVTNHEVFGYFADRYGFEVIGTVIPGGATTDSASAGALADLADLIRDEGVPAIFADTSSSNELADTLAAEVGGDVQVVELYSESLGDADSDGATYLAMIRTNAERIVTALAS